MFSEATATAASNQAPPPTEPPKKTGKAQERRRQKRKEDLQSVAKSQLCTEYLAEGKCSHGAACWFAHGLGELKSPLYFDGAEKLAKDAGRPVDAGDLETARMDLLRRRGAGLNDILKGMLFKKEAVSQYKYSDVHLDYVRALEKVSLNIPIDIMQSHWHLTTEQTVLLKAVVGPRYDPDQNSFRLVKRYRAPFTNLFDPETSFDPLIEKLCMLVSEVKKAAPPVFAFESDAIPYETFPRVPIVPVGH
jgi:hypothetical protein